MDLPQLPERNRANLEGLARVRGETVQETAERITLNILRSIPRATGGYEVDFSELDVVDAGVDRGIPWVQLDGGRIFYDHPATARDAIMYTLLRDRIPTRVRAETFAVAVETIRRYLNGARGVPADAKVAVEAGCYVGYKPIAFADAMGDGGRVVAIEMMSDNFSLLERNVEANGLRDRIVPVHCALSNHVGTVTPRRKQKQQATIAEADVFDDRFVEEGEVPMDTLANVLDRTLPDGATVDYLNVQVNGAELATLQGLGHWRERVRFFHIASPYTVDGVPLRDRVIDLLRSLGATDVRATGTSVKGRGAAAMPNEHGGR